MKQKIIIALSFFLVISCSTFTFAEHTATGFFRTRFIASDQFADKDRDPLKGIDQRFRATLKMDVSENVNVVYQGEVDIQWGDASYVTGRNDGGGMGGDSVNLETKHLYADVKFPNSTISTRIGLQGFGDNWNSTFVTSDMAGVTIRGAVDKYTGTLAYFKLVENQDAVGNAAEAGFTGIDSHEDDVDLWGIQLATKPTEALHVGVDGYYVNIQAVPKMGLVAGNRPYGLQGPFGNTPGIREGKGDLYYVGSDFSYKTGDLTFKGWAAYNFGTFDTSQGDTSDEDLDVSGLAAALQASWNIPDMGTTLNLRGIYFSGDDDPNDDKLNFFVIPAVGEAYPFWDTFMMILTNDPYGTNFAQSPFATRDGAYVGNGLLGFVLDGQFKPQSIPEMYVRGGVSHFIAPQGEDNGAKGNTLGTELCARVGYKVGKADFSINGAVAFLGDLYDGTASDGGNPDTQYEIYAMLNLPFAL